MAGIITALEPQKRSKDRVNVYLDGEFAFGLAAIHAVNLRVGLWLSDEEAAALKAADEVERAREKALDYLSYRPRSEAELQRYLLDRDFSEAVAEDVMQRLRSVGLVDDREFARYWVENRVRFRPRGKRALVQELRQNGVAPEVIEEALAGFDEVAAVKGVFEEQARRLAHLPPDLFRRRLIERLVRRGFPYGVIEEILAAYTFPISKSDESEDS